MLNLLVIITPLKTYLYGQTNFGIEVICLQQLLIECLEKIPFFENRRRKFHFCRREIDYATFASASFADVKWFELERLYYKVYFSKCVAARVSLPTTAKAVMISCCRYCGLLLCLTSLNFISGRCFT